MVARSGWKDPMAAAIGRVAFGLFSANGNRGRANNFLLDGTDMNDGYRNLPAINKRAAYSEHRVQCYRW